MKDRTASILGRAAWLVTLASCALVASSAVADAPWPQYRGPQRDGRSAETGLELTWGPDGPRELWRVELGNGYSAMSVAHGKVFTMYGSADDEFVVAFDAASGRRVWHYRTDENRRDGQGSGPRSTPTVDGDTVYALGARGKLVALDAETGGVRWTVDLVTELGARVPRWGVSTSPIVEGELLFVDVGGRDGYSLAAFDKSTGEVRWHSQTDKAGYSTPIVVEAAGQRQLLFFTSSALVSVSPEDGRLFWRHPWKTSYDVNAAMPVFIPPDKVFISSSYDVGATVLRMVAADGGVAVEPVWRSRAMKNHFNSSVLVGDHLYGFDDGTLTCIRASTGEEAWGKRGFSKGSLVYVDGHLIVFGERGQLAVVEATADEYRERASAQIFRAKTWTMPTVADGRLYLRSESELAAFDLRREPSAGDE